MMKLASMLCTSLVALAALALTAEGASAAPQFSVNASRFDPYKLKANDPNGEKDCTGKGGRVFTDNEGAKTCKDVQDNAVADTGKCAKDQGSANGGAGDGKAGVTARTDSQRGVWKAPAGTEAMHCDNDKGKAAKDTAEPEWKNVPASGLPQKLEEALYRETKWVVFEPNDEPLWAQIRLKVGDYMMSLYRQGIFKGATPKDAFFVKCDRSTMTQNDLDNGRLTILVGFAPLKPAEFVIIKISQHTRGPK